MTLRVGIIGCGFIGQLHSRALKALIEGGLVDAVVVGTCDIDAARAASFARAHPAASATTYAWDLLQRVDVVWICTPTASHAALVEEAAGRGVAVFCEKPLAPTLVDAQRMLEVAVEGRISHQVGLVLRSAPVFRGLRQLLEGGELGPPMAVVFRDDQFFPIQGHYASDWRADVALAGGGALLEHSIHDLDLLEFLLGEVVEVGARTANHAGHPGIEDVAVVTLTFATGAVASLVSVWHEVLSRPSTRRLEVFCQKGLIWCDDDWNGPLHLETSAGHDARPCPDDPWLTGLPVADERWRPSLAQYAPADRSFLDAVAAGRPPEPGLEVGVRAHRVADAVYESAAQGGAPTGTRC